MASEIGNITGEDLRAPDWDRRLEGLIPASIRDKRVLVAGCGSVGSGVAMQLARSGVRHFTLIDPDQVEWPNLTRTTYGHKDVGRSKVDALSDGLTAVFPDIRVRTHGVEIQRLGAGLRCEFESADLIIAAADSPAANGYIDRHCYALGKTVLFIGLYRGAKGGEAVMVRPGSTPCFNCSTGRVRQLSRELGTAGAVREQRDYGTNRLLAEVALGPDIHFVCNASAKLALSLLLQGDAGSPLRDFAARQLAVGCNYVMFGMEPDYFIFPAMHAEAQGQHAFQSVWASTQSDAACEVCGDLALREDPFPQVANA